MTVFTSTRLCTSNPEVVKLVADYIKTVFRKRPGLNGFSISANDDRRFCECDKCRAIDVWAGARKHENDDFDKLTMETSEVRKDIANQDFPSVSITDRMFLFANQVAELVTQEFPDKLLMMFVYSQYRDPPKRVKLNPNVLPTFCARSWAHVSETVREKDMSLLRGFGAFTEKLGIYDYFVNGANGSIPRGFGRIVSRSLREYYDLGCRYFATQAGFDFASNGFVLLPLHHDAFGIDTKMWKMSLMTIVLQLLDRLRLSCRNISWLLWTVGKKLKLDIN